MKKINKEKPLCPLFDADGNIYNLVAMAQNSLREVNQEKEAQKIFERVRETRTYGEALSVIFEYVKPCYANEMEQNELNEEMKMY